MRLRLRLPGGFATKLAAGFVFVLLLVGGSAVVSLQQLARSAQEREALTRRYHEDVIFAERLRSADDSAAAAARGFLITRDAEFLQRLEEAESAFAGALADLTPRVETRAGRELLEIVRKSAADYEQAQRKLLAGETRRDPATVRLQFEQEVEPRRRRLTTAIDAFAAHKERLLEAGHRNALADASRTISISMAGLSLAVFASALFAWATGRHLTRAYASEQEAVRAAGRALAARDELLGIVAHDLRSPLSAIVLNAGMIERATGDERARRHAGSIRTVGLRMEQLIQSLLDAATIEAGRYSIARAPCDVEALLDDTLELAASLAAQRSIQLSGHLRQPELRVLADRDRVLQVLTNLVGNAIKFGHEGGSVQITAERLGDEVGFSVSDDGPGIAHEHLPHLFERFWKGESGGTKGTGLGLYISRAIVEAHGGRIRATSQLGHGATFCFTLPFTEERPVPRPEVRAGRPAEQQPPGSHAG